MTLMLKGTGAPKADGWTLSPPWPMEERDGERRRVLLESKWNLKREGEPLTTNSSPQPSPHDLDVERDWCAQSGRMDTLSSMAHGGERGRGEPRFAQIQMGPQARGGAFNHKLLSPTLSP